jgi:hypothetical protein
VKLLRDPKFGSDRALRVKTKVCFIVAGDLTSPKKKNILVLHFNFILLAVTDEQYTTHCCVSIVTMVTKTHHIVTFTVIAYLLLFFKFYILPTIYDGRLRMLRKIFEPKRLEKGMH